MLARCANLDTRRTPAPAFLVSRVLDFLVGAADLSCGPLIKSQLLYQLSLETPPRVARSITKPWQVVDSRGA